MLADILPTSYEVGVRNGHVRPGDTVVVVGAGPIGLAAITTARLFAPRASSPVDPSPAPRRRQGVRRRRRPRLPEATAEALGSLTMDGQARARGHRGRPVCPSPSNCAHRLVRPADTSRTSAYTANRPPCTSKTCGSATSPSPAWSTNQPAHRCPWTCRRGPTRTEGLITHRFGLDEMLAATTLLRRAETGALKVALFPLNRPVPATFHEIRGGSAMTVRVGINGFGRIGRNYLRAVLDRADDGTTPVRVGGDHDIAPTARSPTCSSTTPPTHPRPLGRDRRDTIVVDGAPGRGHRPP